MPETFKGLPVTKHSLAVRNVGGNALSGTLKVDPREFAVGERFFVLLEVAAGGVKYEPREESTEFEYVQVCDAARGVIVDADVALPHLDELTRKLEAVRVAETGQGSFDEDPLIVEHEQGLHKRRRKACRVCYPVTDEDHARSEEILERMAKAAELGEQVTPIGEAKSKRGGRARAKK